MAGENLRRFNQRRAASREMWASGEIETSELAALTHDLGQASDGVVALAAVVVQKVTFDIIADAKAFAAVDTGYLRSTISAEFDKDGLGSEIGPTAAYGEFVETGTSRQAPQPYMGPARDRREPEFIGALEQIAGDIL